MVIDVHRYYINECSCPLGAWGAILGFPRWMCWLAYKHNHCTYPEWCGCPLRWRGEYPCGRFEDAQCGLSRKPAPAKNVVHEIRRTKQKG